MKKICILALFILSCGHKEDPTPPVVVDDEPKQYGTPFESVPATENVVLYEVNIRAFSEAGNFQGVIDRLDNIRELGINTIWLMPIHPVGKVNSAGGLGSPYSVMNYKEVNPEFGDLAKLRELVDKAHQRGIAVIMDWVANHTSWDNPWITNKSWYTQDGNGNIVIPAGTNWNDVADLNYSNTDMRKAMIAAMKYWVLEANVDGFRCDAADMVPSDFWKSALDQLKAIDNRKLILLAEGGDPSNFTAGFQMNYAWDFYTNMKQVYNNGKAASSIFTTHITEYSVLPAGAKKLRYTTNHDLSAYEGTPVTLFHGIQGALSASAATIFTSVVPLMYSSQEVGQTEDLPFFTKDPIDWSANQTMEAQYEKFFTIYKSSEAFTKGTLKYYPDNDIAAFRRTFESEDFVILVNVRNTTKSFTLPAELANTTWTNSESGSSVSLTTTISLNAYSWLILKKP